MWDFLDFVAANPSVLLSSLTAVRFPVLYFEGESSVTSIDEGLRPLPSHLKRKPELTVVISAEALIRRYKMEHDAGLVEWDPRSRGIRYLTPIAALRPVTQDWFATPQRTEQPLPVIRGDSRPSRRSIVRRRRA